MSHYMCLHPQCLIQIAPWSWAAQQWRLCHCLGWMVLMLFHHLPWGFLTIHRGRVGTKLQVSHKLSNKLHDKWHMVNPIYAPAQTTDNKLMQFKKAGKHNCFFICLFVMWLLFLLFISHKSIQFFPNSPIHILLNYVPFISSKSWTHYFM